MFKAIHAGDPDPKLLSYQYLQMLPELAKGDANKIWVIPVGVHLRPGTARGRVRRTRQGAAKDDAPGDDTTPPAAGRRRTLRLSGSPENPAAALSPRDARSRVMHRTRLLTVAAAVAATAALPPPPLLRHRGRRSRRSPAPASPTRRSSSPRPATARRSSTPSARRATPPARRRSCSSASTPPARRTSSDPLQLGGSELATYAKNHVAVAGNVITTPGSIDSNKGVAVALGTTAGVGEPATLPGTTLQRVFGFAGNARGDLALVTGRDVVERAAADAHAPCGSGGQAAASALP